MHESGPVIERLGVDDWQRARAIRLRALADAPDAFWTTLEQDGAKPEAEWRARLERADAVTFVACQDGADVGLAVGSAHHEDEDDAGLYSLWVAPEARGRGVGKALIQQVVAWARDAAYRSVRLDVSDANSSARALYVATGFTPTGHANAFPPPRQHITEHELRLDLHDDR